MPVPTPPHDEIVMVSAQFSQGGISVLSWATTAVIGRTAMAVMPSSWFSFI